MLLCFSNHITFTLYVVWFNIWLIRVLCIDKLQNDSYDTLKKQLQLALSSTKPHWSCAL